VNRRADLIGQVAALFNEFRETGMSKKLNCNSAADLRANYPQFVWHTFQPYTVDAFAIFGFLQPLRQRVLDGA